MLRVEWWLPEFGKEGEEVQRGDAQWEPTVQLEARKCLMQYINYIFQKPMRFVIFSKCE